MPVSEYRHTYVCASLRAVTLPADACYCDEVADEIIVAVPSADRFLLCVRWAAILLDSTHNVTTVHLCETFAASDPLYAVALFSFDVSFYLVHPLGIVH